MNTIRRAEIGGQIVQRLAQDADDRAPSRSPVRRRSQRLRGSPQFNVEDSAWFARPRVAQTPTSDDTTSRFSSAIQVRLRWHTVRKQHAHG
jgi:hypothetical protein